MRTILSVIAAMRFFSLLLFSVFLTNPSLAQAPQPGVTVLFTGRLFGYVRLPDQQPGMAAINPSHPCPVANAGGSPLTNLSADASVFMTDLQNSRDPDRTVLVSTGDTFAPNYFARAFSSPPDPNRPTQVSKDRFLWDPIASTWVHYAAAYVGAPAGYAALRAAAASSTAMTPTDNVGCFLAYANYDAIVPGKHDFYFGPDWVRKMGRFLAGIPLDDAGDGRHYRPVQILGANIVIKTTWLNDHRPWPDEKKRQLPFDTQYQDPAPIPISHSIKINEFADGGFVYPWIRNVTLNIEGWVMSDIRNPAIFNVYIQEALLENPDQPLPPPAGTHHQLTVPATYAPNANMWQFSLPPLSDLRLQPGHSYLLCAHPTVPPSVRPYCERFTVYAPFFQFPNALPESGYVDVNGQKIPDLWVYKCLPSGDELVIFGVVDPKLREGIGQLNYAWEDVNTNVGGREIRTPEQITRLEIGDPRKSLVQLQQYFDELYGSQNPPASFTGTCRNAANPKFTGKRILLAQMSPSDAGALAAGLPGDLRFDIVVTQADNTLQLPNQETVFTRASTNTGGVAAFKTPTFIAVPPGQDVPAQRIINLRKLQVQPSPRGEKFVLTGEPHQVKIPPQSAAQKDHVNRFWEAAYCADRVNERQQHCQNVGGTVVSNGHDVKTVVAGLGKSQKEDLIQDLTLYFSQQARSTDAALFQQRDFYVQGVDDYVTERCAPSPACTLNLEEILERIIWKGDFLETRAVTGAVLKKIQQTSSLVAASPTDNDRVLVKLGIHRNAYYEEDSINQWPLDLTALYVVATSDYLALGDTGYPDLAQSPIGASSESSFSRSKLETVGRVVCVAFVAVAALGPLGPLNSNCDSTLPAEGYYDRADHRQPNDPRPGETWLRQLHRWSIFHEHLGQRVPSKSLGLRHEDHLQDRATLLFSLEKLSVGFNSLSHTSNDTQVTSDFGGLSDSEPSSLRFHSWDIDARPRFTYSRQFADWFVLTRFQYAARYTGDEDQSKLSQQTSDRSTTEGGMYLHLQGRKTSHVDWLVAGHFEIEPLDPVTFLKLKVVPPATTGGTINFGPGRDPLLLGRTGLRLRNLKSFFEAGGELGRENAIAQFNVREPGVGSITCTPQASQSLTDCINTFNKTAPLPFDSNAQIVTDHTRRNRSGLFWNSSLTVPFLPKTSYQFEDQGDFFFVHGGDNSSDTRIRNTAVQTIKFQIFPNLSIEPTYTIFLFRNKVANNRLVQQQTSIKFNYTFDLSHKHNRREQFKFKKSQ